MWYSATSKKIASQADNEDHYLELLFHNLISSHGNNKSKNPIEVFTVDETCVLWA